jgi:hypothetical protein
VTLPGELVDIAQLPPLTAPGPGVEIMPPLRAFVLLVHVLRAVSPLQRGAVLRRLVELGG